MTDDLQPTAEIAYDEERHEWYWIATGVALTVFDIRNETDLQALSMQQVLDGLMTQTYGGNLAISEMQTAAWFELQEAHIANAIFGAGGDAALVDYALLEQTLIQEATFFQEFMAGIADGSVSEAQARARIAQYSKAIEQSYWNEWKRDLDNSAWSDLPLLTQVPGDGGTQCRGNCQCYLEFTPSGVNWVLLPAEHCDDCLALASGSPYRVN
jgi:hypothetical protein